MEKVYYIWAIVDIILVVVCMICNIEQDLVSRFLFILVLFNLGDIEQLKNQIKEIKYGEW